MFREKGSALVTVILVVLVMTMVGLAAMLFMTVEDTISGNDRYQKEAFYLAEIGLRAGESVLSSVGVSQITTLLQHNDTHNQIPVIWPGDAKGFTYLGTVLYTPTNTAMYMVPVAYSSTTGLPRTGYYNVYVRNDRMDTAGSATIDANGRLDMIAVGVVQGPSGNVQYTKILEEEFFLGSAQGSTLGPQIGGYQSNQNVQSY